MLIPGELYKFNREVTKRFQKRPVMLVEPNMFRAEIKIGYESILLYLETKTFQYSKSPTDVDTLHVFLYDGKLVYCQKHREVFFERVEIT